MRATVVVIVVALILIAGLIWLESQRSDPVVVEVVPIPTSEPAPTLQLIDLADDDESRNNHAWPSWPMAA